eukprot:274365-Chlamydomonas_euryale.AAC.1
MSVWSSGDRDGQTEGLSGREDDGGKQVEGWWREGSEGRVGQGETGTWNRETKGHERESDKGRQAHGIGIRKGTKKTPNRETKGHERDTE